jgi:hypothetical protein
LDAELQRGQPGQHHVHRTECSGGFDPGGGLFRQHCIASRYRRIRRGLYRCVDHRCSRAGQPRLARGRPYRPRPDPASPKDNLNRGCRNSLYKPVLTGAGFVLVPCFSALTRAPAAP